MPHRLLTKEDYENLPEDDLLCFVEIEELCRDRYEAMRLSIGSENLYDAKLEYMSVVDGIAKECGIDIDYPDPEDNFEYAFRMFQINSQSHSARIRVKRRSQISAYSVLLTSSTKEKVEHYIGRIRDLVEKSGMEDDRKRRLFERLDELSGELSSQRFSFAKAMAILAGVTATLSSVVTIAADGQSAVAHIVQFIGQDKASEEEATKRLAPPPPKALPAPAVKKPAMGRRSAPLSETLDDDIPF